MKRVVQISARSVAFELLYRVASEDAYANLLLPKLLSHSKLEQRDRALAQELAFGTLRSQLLYDKIIELCANRAASEIDLKALTLLRLGCHQLLALRTATHAAINETVNLAKGVASLGAAGFINGVLRRVSEKSATEWKGELLARANGRHEALEVSYSHPAWIIRSLEKALTADGRANTLEELLAVDNQSPLVNLVALPQDVQPIIPESLTAGPASPIGFTLPSGDPAQLAGVKEGWLRVQDQGSQLAALALVQAKELSTNEKWLDMCAGPGGKAALLAAIAKQSDVELEAHEVAEHRAKLVAAALRNVDPRVKVVCSDSTTVGERSPQKFDRILLDAPCTGLGALRRRPESRYRKQPADVAQLSELQTRLISSAWQALKPGGVLAYVTCSPHLGETVAIVDWLLRNNRQQASLLDAPQTLLEINPTLQLNSNRKTAQLWPHVNSTDAMFIALFAKSVG